MAALFRRLFGPKKQRQTRKDSITGRNKTLARRSIPFAPRGQPPATRTVADSEGNNNSRNEGVGGMPVLARRVEADYFTVPKLDLPQNIVIVDIRATHMELMINGVSTRDEVEGRILRKSVGNDSFVINLTSGPLVEADEPGEVLDNRLLSIRCDVGKGKICFNACVDGEWGKEGAIKQRYHPQDEFDIRVRCFEDVFHIYVEHRLVAKFAHYVSMSTISHVYVNGDVLLYGVSWEGKFYQVPYAADIPGNFFPTRRLFVSGLVSKAAKQFNIDFHAGTELAARIRTVFPLKKVLRTSRLNDRWGPEERLGDQDFPFKRKQTFDLLIYCGENKFEVFVNDCHFASFDHRIPPDQINKLSIDGDIILLGVHLK